MTDGGGKGGREDLHKHLEFIQTIVTRMSAASASAKSWLLPVVTAAYGYGVSQNAWSIIALGIGAVLLFLFLDVHYLDREKAYRSLYDAVAKDEGIVPVFSLNPRALSSTSTKSGASREMTADDADDADEALASTATPDAQRGSEKGRIIKSWIPEDGAVWLSWAIAPFYGALLLVGLVLVIRVGLS